MPFSQYFPERGLVAYFKRCCLRIWLPVILHQSAEWQPLLCEWQFLVLPQILGGTKNKEDGLTITKVWDNNELRLAERLSFISSTRPILDQYKINTGRVGCLSKARKLAQRIKESAKTKAYVSKKKRQNSRNNLNETEIYLFVYMWIMKE